MRHRDELRVPASVPGSVLRMTSAVAIAGGTLLLNPYPLWCWIAALSALVSVFFRRSMAAWIGIACLPLGLMLTPPAAGRTALAILLIHLAHVLAAWAWAAPWRSRIQLPVLLPGLRRMLVIQAIAQSVAAVMVLAVPPLQGPGYGWLAPCGAAVLTGASALALRLSSARGPGVDAPAGSGGGASVGGRS